MRLQKDLNLRHLRAFCEVAERGTIAAAAAAVLVSPSALTQALAKLERTLGVPLLDRSSTGMTLTAPGRIFHHRVARALAYLRTGAAAPYPPARQKKGGFAAPASLPTHAQIRALLALSRTGNFTWAAREIGISQPSLHRAARDLEHASGQALFTRTAQGIRLTARARELERAARLAVAELNQGLDELAARSGREASWIRIGCLPLARSHILPQAINRFSETHPDMRFHVREGAYADLYRALAGGELDFLIGALRDPVPTGDVVQAELLRDGLVIVARRGHPLAGRRDLTLADLRACSWVVPSETIPTRVQFDRLFAEEGLAAPERVVETSSMVLMRGVLQGSDRLAIISRHQIAPEIAAGILVQIGFDVSTPPRAIGLSVRSGWVPTRAQAAFRDALARTCQGLTQRRKRL